MNIYVDMDGVIAKYERGAYACADKGTPMYMRPGGHYFKKVKPDVRMIEVVKSLCDTKHRLNILTNVSNQGSMFLEQANDKREWLHEHCPCINTDTQFIAIASTKRFLVESLNMADGKYRIAGHILTADDLLIDDYNKNLDDWVLAGGTAIKYLNGENTSETFAGIHLDLIMTSDQIFALITQYLDFQNNFNRKEETP